MKRAYRLGFVGWAILAPMLFGLLSFLAFLTFQRGPLHAADCYLSAADGWTIEYPTSEGTLSEFRSSIKGQTRNCVSVSVIGPTDDEAVVVAPIGTRDWISSAEDRFVSVSTRTSAEATQAGLVDADGQLEVLLVGQRVRDSFCVQRTCWPISGVSMVESGQLVRVSGVLTEDGFEMAIPMPPYPDDVTVDSNSTERAVHQWLADRPEIESWSVEGDGNGGARVWLAAIDPAIHAQFDEEFGDQVEIDGETIVFNASLAEYKALHERIGTSPVPEPYIERWGETCVAGSTMSEEICRLVAYAHNSGLVTLAVQPRASDEVLLLNVREQDCANGRMPTPEDIVVIVNESADRIVVGVLFVPPQGSMADCPGNPVAQTEVSLASPVGDREVVDYVFDEPLPLGMPAG